MIQRLKQFVKAYWEIGVVKNSIEGIIDGEPLCVNWIHHKFRDRWFADPFILSASEQEIVLLVEDFRFADQKARISKLVIDRESMTVSRCVSIISGDSHFSFPFVLFDKGKVFVCPENSCEGVWPVYEYHKGEERCDFVRSMSSLPLTDAIVADVFGKRLLLSTMLPLANGKRLGVWEQSDVDFSTNVSYWVDFQEAVARNAGAIFKVANEWYRPAQECNKWYGHAVSLQQITLKEGKLHFNEVRRLSDCAGIHTFNIYNGVIVIDRKRFRIPWLSKLVYAFWKKKDL